METFNNNNIWALMREHNLKVDSDSINDDLLCFICKSLMSDACHTVCGCQFCYNCISEYIRNVDKYCPGNKMNCKLDYLSLENDVIRDNRMNKRIFQSKVLCPNETCNFKTELMLMGEHLRVCTQQSMECPYMALGCDNEKQSKDALLIHLNKEILPHTNILLEYIYNLTNDIDKLKSLFETNKLEMSKLKEESIMKDTQIKEIMLQMAEQKTDIELLKEECLTKENKIAILEEQISDMGLRLCTIVEEKKKTEKYIENKINERMNDQENKIKDQKKEIECLKVIKSEGVYCKEDSILNDWIESCSDFIWKVKGYSKIIKAKDIYSAPFYSNNYKFRLTLYVKIDNRVWFDCIIMKGDYDDTVKWPMKHKVTLSIINQRTLKAHNSVTLHYDTYTRRKYVFDRNVNDNWIGIGTFDLFNYSEIVDDASIIVNDGIVLSFRLSE